MTIPVGYYQASLRFAGPAVPLGAEITFGGLNFGSFDALGCYVAVITALNAAALTDNLSTDITTDGLLIKLGPDATGASFLGPSATGGALSGTSTAPSVAALCRKSTALGGRQGRGRFYLPGLVSTDVQDGGVLAAGRAADINTDLGVLLAQLDAEDVPMALLHDGAMTPTAVTGLTVDSKVATQRRRLRR